MGAGSMSTQFGPVHTTPPGELESASLLDTDLRVWAEVGRTRMPAAYVVGMSEGAIVDLDCEADDPADLYVNGRHFGTGRLILVDGEWALRVETLDDSGDDENGDPEDDDDHAVEHLSSPDQGAPAAADCPVRDPSPLQLQVGARPRAPRELRGPGPRGAGRLPLDPPQGRGDAARRERAPRRRPRHAPSDHLARRDGTRPDRRPGLRGADFACP